MSSEKPLVSVVVCTFNGEQFLKDQLNSIVCQTYNYLEIIIMDDASTDHTKEIIETFARKDERIQCYFSKNTRGVNKNFEQAFLKATGEYISIADQDDIWKYDKIENLIGLFKPGIMLVHGASVNFEGTKLPLDKTYQHSFIPMTGNDARKLLLRNSISGHSLVFHKALLQYCLPIPTSLYYDWWICVVAACRYRIAATGEVLVYHRIHANNAAMAYKKIPGNKHGQSIKNAAMRLRLFYQFLTFLPQQRNLQRCWLKNLQRLNKNNFRGRFFYFCSKIHGCCFSTRTRGFLIFLI